MKAFGLTCKTVRADLVAYLDGELTGRRAGKVSRHVSSCAGCQGEATEIRRVTDMLARLPRERLDEAAERTVLGRMRATIETGRPSRRAIGWRLPALATVAVAGMLLIWQIQTTTAPKPVDVGAGRASSPAPVARAEPQGRPAPAPPVRVAEPEKAGAAGNRGVEMARRQPSSEEPGNPPRPLYERPDLFLDFPIVLDLEKLEDFEAVMQAHPVGGGGFKRSGHAGRG